MILFFSTGRHLFSLMSVCCLLYSSVCIIETHHSFDSPNLQRL